MSRTPALTVRPDLAGLSPYVSPQRPARFRMNTNESPYPPPPEVLSDALDELRSIPFNRYPDRDAPALLEALAGHLGRPPASVWAANGSNEVFMHLFLAFAGPGRTVMIFEPTYSLHGMLARVSGARVVSLPRTLDFAVDFDRAAEAIAAHRPEMVVTCSPNNPTGNCDPPSTVRVLLEEAPGLVVVDEAYAEFALPNASAIPLVAEHPNLVVSRTFSKAWRLAGARLGYLTAAPDLVQQLSLVRLPYHLSSFTQVLGRAALRHAHDTLDAVRSLVAERERITAGLQALGVRVWPSEANFVLFEVDEPERVWNALLARDVLVRSYAGVNGVERCLRVTAGLPEETDAFLDALKGALDE